MEQPMSPEALCDRLNILLSSLPITEVEIFKTPSTITTPNPHHPFLVYGNHQLAIPQKTLAIIYASVSQRFHRICENNPTTGQQDPDEVFQLTRLLLIQNPDHLTALSTRRKLIDHHLPRHPDQLAKELELTKLLLSIASHSKSTALWFHRRWAFHHLFPPSTLTQPSTRSDEDKFSSKIYRPLADLPPQVLKEELEFSLKTCELYPRNYYGWFHRKWLFYQLVHSADRSSSMREEEIEAERVRILDFIRLHPRDHSAANYVTFLLSCAPLPSVPSVPHPNQQPEPFDSVSPFIRDCYAAFAQYPHFESSWSFLKFLALSNTLSLTQSLTLIQSTPIVLNLRNAILAAPAIPAPSSPTPSRHPEHVLSSSKITLADLHADTLRHSQTLCLRTLYFLGSHFKWIQWTDEMALFLLKLTTHHHPSSSSSCFINSIFTSDSDSIHFLDSLKILINRFLP
ncbi:uncharacterized protein PGTG_19763 [Puccinia graminis f. sp. tritici CRL 75-36-700-3]|uniref:Geranylgeranyl transferase type-2 subunit alpha n=1 Tax=Puccinia graminis f. sp. tritici (strain CRL 75-36-700-3 / race SCCL) TaxID=418459 RepID=E3LBE1_PUCGT|nr:uncharacterized protein PGTG_19763 [Puccinia graminis f. sp. tritici CRL 75-36-700-3]EFP93866.2 hypothetical protein PGTG_19763 [Puccinia graminis f. sp. tritici CRL 75-36-700-3]